MCLLTVLAACNVNPIPTSSPVARHTPTVRPVPADALVIENGDVIDGTGAAPIQDGIVIVLKDRILAVSHAADFSIPPDTTVIDAKGGTIMPGIINAHVHDAGSALVRKFYFLNHGVTSACDLGAPLSGMPRFVDNTGYGLTARGFRAGPVINVPQGYPGTGELLYPVSNPEQAHQAVTDLVDRGADYIKIALEPWNSKLPWQAPPPGEPLPSLDLPEIKAIVEQAHAAGKLVRVHLGTAELFDLALDGGVDVIEHIPLPKLSDIEFQTGAQVKDYAKLSAAYEAQLARMVKQHIVMVPTLDEIIPWCEGFAITPERKELCRQYALTPVHRFHQMGGTIALGDDSNSSNRTLMPVGEMRRLLSAGLTSMEIIRAGTQRAAQVCGHGDELGTLEPGKLADIIVVKGDPLADIGVMDQIGVVLIGGQVAVPCDPNKTSTC